MASYGNFNTAVGCDGAYWDGVVAEQGVAECSSSCHLLLQNCAKHDLLNTNRPFSIFRLPNRNKISWSHPLSKHWHLIYYVIDKNRGDVRITRVMYEHNTEKTIDPLGPSLVSLNKLKEDRNEKKIHLNQHH